MWTEGDARSSRPAVAAPVAARIRRGSHGRSPVARTRAKPVRPLPATVEMTPSVPRPCGSDCRPRSRRRRSERSATPVGRRAWPRGPGRRRPRSRTPGAGTTSSCHVAATSLEHPVAVGEVDVSSSVDRDADRTGQQVRSGETERGAVHPSLYGGATGRCAEETTRAGRTTSVERRHDHGRDDEDQRDQRCCRRRRRRRCRARLSDEGFGPPRLGDARVATGASASPQSLNDLDQFVGLVALQPGVAHQIPHPR